jgi:hypothetical protein
VPVETRADARRALLAGLVDHAPTFPPAELPAAEALAADRSARAGEHAWLLGRLVWRASRLDDLAGYDDVPLSLVLDAPVPGPRPGTAPPAAVEVRWPALPEFHGEVFVELPVDRELEASLERLRAAGALAKVRCGGERTPSGAELARFVRACASAGVPFKASAGLHHAVRRGERHGFLNLLAAAQWPDLAEEALAAEDLAEGLALGHVFSWHGRTAAAEEVARMRRHAFRGFGSCSFDEPVDDLRELGLL